MATSSTTRLSRDVPHLNLLCNVRTIANHLIHWRTETDLNFRTVIEPRRPESRVPSGGPSALRAAAEATPECLLMTMMLKRTGGAPGPRVE